MANGKGMRVGFIGASGMMGHGMAKNILAAVIAVALHRAFPDILVRRVRRSSALPAKV